jgi:hypothetical protein
MGRPITYPIHHKIARIKKTKLLTGGKSLIENKELYRRMILKRAIKIWAVCEQSTE